jgi:hypothetical protein
MMLSGFGLKLLKMDSTGYTAIRLKTNFGFLKQFINFDFYDFQKILFFF